MRRAAAAFILCEANFAITELTCETNRKSRAMLGARIGQEAFAGGNNRGEW
jgi:hypothetical protein